MTTEEEKRADFISYAKHEVMMKCLSIISLVEEIADVDNTKKGSMGWYHLPEGDGFWYNVRNAATEAYLELRKFQ